MGMENKKYHITDDGKIYFINNIGEILELGSVETLFDDGQRFEKNIESIAIPPNSKFDRAAFRRATYISYQKGSTSKMAVAADQIAQIIRDNFDTQGIRCMVPASQIASNAKKGALPIHFLFTKYGQPKVAVVIVTQNGYNTPNVLATKSACESMGVKYLRIYADGSFADWIEGRATQRVINLCKSRIVERIKDGLR